VPRINKSTAPLLYEKSLARHELTVNSFTKKNKQKCNLLNYNLHKHIQKA